MEYKCTKCGATSVKLWRQYQTLLENIRLLCGKCACKNQSIPYKLSPDGKRMIDYGERTDQIGWLMPAVPLDDGSFWGYTSAPPEACHNWRIVRFEPMRKPENPESVERFKDATVNRERWK